MGESKRKAIASAAEPPTKKTKKSAAVKKNSESTRSAVSDLVQTLPSPKAIHSQNGTVQKGTKERKRATDFMSDEEDNITPKKKGKNVRKAELLTADGANGILEHSEDEGVEIAAPVRPAKGSLMAEAERTADAELQEEFGGISDEQEGEDEEIDQAPALLAGFDSDNDDPAEDAAFDKTRTAPIPQFKKTSKKLRNAAAQKSDGPGTVYIGRIPHGFYETEMRAYFSQFGDISRLRLSRNKRTGASKHFAFVEFASVEVAKIVAETMDNYLMFGHILKCKFAPSEALHPDVWKGANTKFRKLPHHRIAKQKEEQPKTVEQWEKKNEKEKKRREKKAKLMKAIGYEFHMPELADPGITVEKAKKVKELEANEALQIEGTSTQVAEPNSTAEPTKPQKSKKSKKADKVDTASIQPVTEVVTQTAEQPSENSVGKKSKKTSKTETKPPTIQDSTSGKSTAKAKEGKAPKQQQPKSILKKSSKA